MAVIKVPLEGLGERVERDFAKLRPFMHQALYDIVATRGVALAVAETQRARPRTPVDRGTYIRSFAAAKVADGVWLYNSAPYAGVIEHGRRPGTKMPPIKELTAWVLRKGLAGNKPGRVTRVSPNIAKAAKSIAFAIGRKMKKEGWPSLPNAPMKIVEKASKNLLPEVQAAMKEAIGRALGGTP